MIDNTTPLIQIDRPTFGDVIRKIAVANALSIKNISGSDKTKDIFIELLGPINGVWDLKKTSTCAIVARGLFRRLKIDYPPIYKSYIYGTAISSEISWASKIKPRSVWQTPIKDAQITPGPGDYIVIGSGLSTHVLTMISFENDNIISIDGGQVDDFGYQCVKMKKRKWTEINGFPYIDDRKVIGWIPIDILPFIENEKIIAPEGWETI